MGKPRGTGQRPRIMDVLRPAASAQDRNAGTRTTLLVLVVLAAVGAAVAGSVLLVMTTQDFGYRGADAADAAGVQGKLELVSAHMMVDGDNQTLYVTVKPHLGMSVDLADITLNVHTDGKDVDFHQNRLPLYGVAVERDRNNSVRADRPVMDSGDLVRIMVPMTDENLRAKSGGTITVTQWADAPLDAWTLAVPGGRLSGVVPLEER